MATRQRARRTPMESDMMPARQSPSPEIHHALEGGHAMPQYLYQAAYTSESLAAQIKNPQDRLELVGEQRNDDLGARILAGGYSYGEYDVWVIVDGPDDVSMAPV